MKYVVLIVICLVSILSLVTLNSNTGQLIAPYGKASFSCVCEFNEYGITGMRTVMQPIRVGSAEVINKDYCQERCEQYFGKHRQVKGVPGNLYKPVRLVDEYSY